MGGSNTSTRHKFKYGLFRQCFPYTCNQNKNSQKENKNSQKVLDTQPRAPAFIIKANEGLKPKILGDDTDPVELEPWLKRFRAFYANSQMQQAEIEEQRTYLEMYLDGRVRTEMDRLTRTDLPIYVADQNVRTAITCLLYTSPSPRDGLLSRMPSSA